MLRFLFVALVALLAFILPVMAEETAPPQDATTKPKPLPAPSNAKFNSVVTNKPAPGVAATAGQALTADGTGLHSIWAFVKGTNINSSPASSGTVLIADGNGGTAWSIPQLTNAAGVLPIANGGTGSSTQNFVDLTTNQTVAGSKTFSASIVGNLTGNASGTAANVTGIVAIANGGTGSATQNFVDLTTNQTVAGSKTFSASIVGNLTGNVSGTAANVTGIVAIANGGTGSSTQNFVDLTSAQNPIAGNKTFTGTLNVSSAFVVEARPNNTNTTSNLFIGLSAGASNTSGAQNTFVGYSAGAANIATNNTFVGSNSGVFNSTGSGNAFFGEDSGFANTTGSGNSFVGQGAGVSNTNGQGNSFIGQNAGAANVTNNGNTFLGQNAGAANTADSNTFVGQNSGAANTTGSSNAFFGQNSGQGNTAGAGNAFFGANAGFFNTQGTNNTFVGRSAGQGNTTAANNSFFGTSAGLVNKGGSNTFVGASAGTANTTGFSNTFIGQNSGAANVTNIANTFLGQNAGAASTADNNTFIGQNAGAANTIGGLNTFIGTNAGSSISSGGSNIAIGFGAGVNLTTGSNDIEIGNNGIAAEANTTRIGTPGTQTNAFIAGIVHADDGISVNKGATAAFIVEARPNNVGSSNLFIGSSAGTANTTGANNVCVGVGAGQNNITANNNTFVGLDAGQASTGGANCFFGELAGQSNTSGQNNIGIGASGGDLLTTGNFNIAIGSRGVAGESGAIRIGTSGSQTATFIQGISGVTVSGGTAVSILANGQLGTITSSRRFKDNIQPMGSTSDALLKLNPVTFTYKKELDPKRIPQWGLIAEEVAAVNPDWVVYDEKGVINTVRYEQINAMLLNEFLKDHRRADVKDEEIAKLQQENSAMEKRLADQEARLARIEKALGDETPNAIPASFDVK